MAEFNDFKEKAMNMIGSMADITKDAAIKTADAARSLTRIAKLTVDINGEKEMVKKAYYELGKLYYELHRDDAEGFFSQIVQEVTVTLQGIADMEQEIEDLKSAVRDKGTDGIEVEFEEVVAGYEEVLAEVEEIVPTVDEEDIQPLDESLADETDEVEILMEVVVEDEPVETPEDASEEAPTDAQEADPDAPPATEGNTFNTEDSAE